MNSLGWYLSFVMKDTPSPGKRYKYDAAFRAEALRLIEQSRSAQAAARALNIDSESPLPVAESGPNASCGRIGRGVEPGHGSRVALTASRQPAAGAGNVKKSHRQ